MTETEIRLGEELEKIFERNILAEAGLPGVPNTLEEMISLGRFNKRLLAQKLGMFADERRRNSFLAMSNEMQSKYLFDYAVDLARKRA